MTDPQRNDMPQQEPDTASGVGGDAAHTPPATGGAQPAGATRLDPDTQHPPEAARQQPQEAAEQQPPQGADAAQTDAGGEAQAADAQEQPEEDPLAVAQRERDQYLDQLLRTRAEFDNFRKRMAKERTEALDRGAERLVAGMLGVLDNLGFALDAADNSEDVQLAKGVQMVHAELMGVLGQAGLSEVPGKGAPFDPEVHEAVMQVEDEQAGGEEGGEPVVVDVLRRGWMFKGRLLRPASVSVTGS